MQSYVAKGMDAEAVGLAFIALKGQLEDSTVRSPAVPGSSGSAHDAAKQLPVQR